MDLIWTRRLRIVATTLAAVTVAVLGVAGILWTAGDATGGAALAGFASVTGFAFVVDLCVLTLGTRQSLSE